MTSQARILVFDRAIAPVIAFLLGRLGYSAKHVSDFEALLHEIKESHFDLLILEVCDFYCSELADEFQKLPGKVLFVSCGAEGHGFRLPTGAERLIEKPINVEEFTLTVRELLGEKVQ